MLTNSNDSNPLAPAARQASIPAELADVALIDAKLCAAAGCMSVSQWHNLVREGVAPRPAIRLSRYTRWNLAEVRAFFVGLANQKREDQERMVMDRARKASAASKAKRKQESTASAGA